MLEYQKTPPNSLEVRIHGPAMLGSLGLIALFLGVANIGLAFGLQNWIYFVLAVVLLVAGMALRRVYGGRVMSVEKGRGKVRLHPGLAEKGEPRSQEWPETEVTEARLTSRQVFVGKEKETRLLVSLSRRSLKPTALLECDTLEEAIEFCIRLCRLLKCDLVDATVVPVIRVPIDQISELRKKVSAELEEGERVLRPGAVTRRRRGGGYEYRWMRHNSRGVTIYGTIAAFLVLTPVYVVQATYLLWPLVLLLPAAGLAYLAFAEWATVYTLAMDAQGLEFVDGRRASETRKLRWDGIRGLRRIPGKGGTAMLDVRTARPLQIFCTNGTVAAYLEEQFSRFHQRYAAPAG